MLGRIVSKPFSHLTLPVAIAASNAASTKSVLPDAVLVTDPNSPLSEILAVAEFPLSSSMRTRSYPA